VTELAQKLARFQALKVPFKKENATFKNFKDLHTRMYQRFPGLEQMIVQLNLETLKSKSILTEVDWCEKVVHALNASQSFVHYDFRDMNLLVKDVGGTEGNHLVVCDFEYASYGYRGIDFGSLFYQWGRQGMVKHPLPVDNVMKAFFDEYIAEMVKINGENYLKDKRNCSDFMIKETKIFHLVRQLFICMICIGMEDDNQIETFNKENMLVSFFLFNENIIEFYFLTNFDF
jgi:thiamine kinase-like enzyme